MEEVLGGRDTCWVSRKERQGWLVGSDLVHSWFLLSLVLGSSLRPQSLRRSACSEQGLKQVCLHHSESMKETGHLSSPLHSPSETAVKQVVRLPSSPPTDRMFPVVSPCFLQNQAPGFQKRKAGQVATEGRLSQASALDSGDLLTNCDHLSP